MVSTLIAPELGGRGGSAGGRGSSVKSRVAWRDIFFVSTCPLRDIAPMSIVACRDIPGLEDKARDGRGGGAGAPSGSSTVPCFGKGGGGSSGEGILKSSGVLTLLLVVPSCPGLSLRVVGGVLELALISNTCGFTADTALAGFSSDVSNGPWKKDLANTAEVSKGSTSCLS